jgi:PAS domain S-box-containing protein
VWRSRTRLWGLIKTNAEYERIWGCRRPETRSVDDYAAYRAWWADSGMPLAPEEWASAQAVRTGQAVTGQVLEIERFDGSRAVVINSASPVRDADGRVVGSAVAIQDITELRLAQEALRLSWSRYRALAENFRVALKASPVTLATLDATLRFTWVYNTRHGFTQDVVLGKRPDELIPPEDAAELMDLLRHVLATGVAEQREVSGHTGNVRWDYSATVEPQLDERGAVIGLTLAEIDISARKAMEEALRETDRRRTHFLAVLSHELRNPLAPIQSALGVLHHVTPGSDEARRAQQVIERQVRQLARLVDDLLDVTRITTDRIHLQLAPVDLVELVARTVDDVRPLFDRRGVQLELEVPATPVVVEGDSARLAQIVSNLLHNAAKFTPPGGTTTVTMDADAGSQQVAVIVADTGVGIDPDVLPKLFQPVMQARPTLDRSEGGLGLGLALVKSLAELHGGGVEASSAGPGQGTQMVVRLPIHGPLAVPQPPQPPLAIPARRVLVIDDNFDGAESLRVLLQLSGHAVEVAHAGPQGVAAARGFHPDVVICDLGLPGMDGFEVARAIRREASPPAPLLVALSGYALPGDIERSLEAGFDLHLAKPPDLDKLGELITSHAGRSASAGEPSR